MFWGITLETTKRYSQVVSDNFHVSMAALEPRNHSGKGDAQFISVMLEREKSEFLLCNLHHDKQIQQPLDLHFIQGEEITFYISGDGVVHLTGYITGPDYEEEDFDESDSEESETEVDIAGGKRKALPSQIVSKSKKAKLEDLDSDDYDEVDSEDDESDEEESEDDDKPSPVKSLQTPKGNRPNQTNKTPPKNDKNLSNKQTPVKPQQTNKQTPKSAGQPKQEVNGNKSLGDSEQQKKKRKRNKKKKGNNTTTDSDGASLPATPKTPITQKPQSSETPKPKPQKLQGGVMIEELKIGEGKEAKSGAVVNMYYLGRFQKNNKVFDSVKKGEKPFKFRLGRGEVIKGWDIGVQGMKAGGKRRITIPSAQAYGSRGNEAIPPNSDLVFDVELEQIH
ncbi:hypothetical protein CHUAL_000990 [Chamberlinius hualienensis]